MFLLLTKTVMFIMHVFWPPLSIIIHVALIALYSFSIYAQSSHDTTDAAHSQGGAPWYLTRSCSISSTSSIKGYCEQAKAAFAMTIVMLYVQPYFQFVPKLTRNSALFTLYLVYAIWSNFTGKKPVEDDDDTEARGPSHGYGKEISPESVMSTEHHWEMQNMPRTPGTTGGIKSPPHQGYMQQPIYTPRTQAFHQLGGAQ